MQAKDSSQAKKSSSVKKSKIGKSKLKGTEDHSSDGERNGRVKSVLTTSYWRDLKQDTYVAMAEAHKSIWISHLKRALTQQTQDRQRIATLFAAGRKSGAHISGGQFVARLAEHFGLLTAEILGGLTIITLEILIIDMGELDAPIVDEGGQADPTPVQAPPPLPAAPARTMPQRMARLEEDVHEIHGALTEQREVIDAMARYFSRFSTWAITGLERMMDRAGVAYVPYSETHVPYQRRRVRQRTSEANTSAAQQDPQ
ncbi:hypothetical protein Tco_0348260, partial [Tanacetum coccineum]